MKLKKKLITPEDIARGDQVHQFLDQAGPGPQALVLTNGESVAFTEEEIAKWPLLRSHLIDGVRGAFTNCLLEAEDASLEAQTLEHQVARCLRSAHLYRLAAESLWLLLKDAESSTAERRHEFLREENGTLRLIDP